MSTQGEPSSSQEANSPSASPAPAASSTAASSPSQEGTAPLQRLHILPFTEVDEKLGSRSRIDFIAPELRRIRADKVALKTGDLIRHEDLEFAIIKCDPPEGTLGMDTDYFVDGNPVIKLDKIQFSAWGPPEKMNADLFEECVVPYFKDDYAPYGSKGAKCVRLFYNNQVIRIGEIHLQVDAVEPQGLGVVTNDTEIFANWDTTPEFEKVHFMPFQDTLPRAYAFDVFTDYLKPYLNSHVHKKYQVNELFMYQGVQFKLVACEPNVAARIGKSTTIYCEGVLHPSLRNLLPPELLSQVAQLPPGLQMLLLNTERTQRELEEVLTQRRGLFEDTISQIETFRWPPPSTDRTDQTSCRICLGDFEPPMEVCRLPCRHVFCKDCAHEWLRRCTDCPICKDNVDRAIRHY